MPSDKQSNRNQPKHWHECTGNFDEESNKTDDELGNDAEESKVTGDIQDNSDDPERDAATDQDSGDESETSYVVTENTSDDEPPKSRRRCQQEVQRPEFKTFIARSGRPWATEETPIQKLLLANIIRQRHGVGRQIADIQTVKEAFQLFMTPGITYLRLRETNRHAQILVKKNNEVKQMAMKD
ncbi:unnamed protein product [Rotaria magnacalcarata]|uniref:Uncharacterized protein n=1 Tax=Rotaria magnacalcarata TaxID=392030 RepID=A0A815LV31_9BILA|nr:unnamed protein product [Rotaria magnacalcarata]CAF1412715.1 unnamed protein product [Rotaria magnacalcarata]CAF3811989.1 unnamed protein product [Rotaria magnacalcarata]CAF3908650.1 unnamed protein product [Rotaria magnacalcarata]